MSPAAFSPRPVSVTTPTMMPATAVVASTGSTSSPPATSAPPSRRGPSRSSGRPNTLSATAAIVAQNTARNGDKPDRHQDGDQDEGQEMKVLSWFRGSEVPGFRGFRVPRRLSAGLDPEPEPALIQNPRNRGTPELRNPCSQPCVSPSIIRNIDR